MYEFYKVMWWKYKLILFIKLKDMLWPPWKQLNDSTLFPPNIEDFQTCKPDQVQT